MSGDRRRVVLLAGPSGSGKSRLAQRSGLPIVNLDEFYRSDSEPDLPRLPGGLIDWDDPRAWQADQAIAALESLCHTGSAVIPRYDMTINGPTGEHRVSIEPGQYLIAEGIFAGEIARELDRRQVLAHALCVRRPRLLTMVLRFARDVREARKRLPVLLARGWRLMRQEPAIIARLQAQGFTAASPGQIDALLRRLAARS